MQATSVPHNALVLIGDGRKALFLRNHGTPLAPKFIVERLLQHENPPTREQGTDKPGRVSASVGSARSATEETDWHQLEEARFAGTLADALYRFSLEEPDTAIIVVAPPKTLGELRGAYHKGLEDHIISEIPKELTAQPIPHLEKVLTATPD